MGLLDELKNAPEKAGRWAKLFGEEVKNDPATFMEFVADAAGFREPLGPSAERRIEMYDPKGTSARFETDDQGSLTFPDKVRALKEQDTKDDAENLALGMSAGIKVKGEGGLFGFKKKAEVKAKPKAEPNFPGRDKGSVYFFDGKGNTKVVAEGTPDLPNDFEIEPSMSLRDALRDAQAAMEAREAEATKGSPFDTKNRSDAMETSKARRSVELEPRAPLDWTPDIEGVLMREEAALEGKINAEKRRQALKIAQERLTSAPAEMTLAEAQEIVKTGKGDVKRAYKLLEESARPGKSKAKVTVKP